MKGISWQRVGRASPYLRGLALIAAALAVGATVVAAQAPDTAQEAKLESAVRAAILTDMTIVTLPAGSTPGHVSERAQAELRDRLVRVLPTVYTGSLLTTKLQALSTTVDALASSEMIGMNTAAGITSLVIDASIVNPSHATLHGTLSVWVTGRHKEDGAIKDDRVEGSYTFTAGLEKVNDVWLVSSWDDQQLN